MRSISSDIGFSLISVEQWERRCQLGCHFEDGPPSFASFLRSVSQAGQSGHSLPVHLHLHARQTDVEITVSTTFHAWTLKGVVENEAWHRASDNTSFISI